MNELTIRFDNNGVMQCQTRVGDIVSHFEKRASDIVYAEMIGELYRLPESNWSVIIAIGSVGVHWVRILLIVKFLTDFLSEKNIYGQDKLGFVVKLNVTSRVDIPISLSQRIHELVRLLPNLNHIKLQPVIAWDKTFEYIIEASPVQTLCLELLSNYVLDDEDVPAPTLMMKRIADIFERVKNAGMESRITNLSIKGDQQSYLGPIIKMLQNCPQLQMFSISSVLWLQTIQYYNGSRLELSVIRTDDNVLQIDGMQKILSWANMSQTLKKIKFGYVAFHPLSIAALYDDITKDTNPRTYIKDCIFVGCSPGIECTKIKTFLDQRNKALDLASICEKINMSPTTIQLLIHNLLGLKLPGQ